MNRQLTKSIETLLGQIGAMLEALSDEQYQRTLPVLSGATLGGHVRHVIEFFIELDRGYLTGEVNYDARSRDKAIEQHRQAALASLRGVTASLNKENKVLLLASAAEGGNTGFQVATNYERELVYNLEHVVHHMALMKIGIRALTALHLPESFGVAGSTLRYRQAQCAP